MGHDDKGSSGRRKEEEGRGVCDDDGQQGEKREGDGKEGEEKRGSTSND